MTDAGARRGGDRPGPGGGAPGGGSAPGSGGAPGGGGQADGAAPPSGTRPAGIPPEGIRSAGIPPEELGTLAALGDALSLLQLRRWPVAPGLVWRFLTEPDLLATWLGRPGHVPGAAEGSEPSHEPGEADGSEPGPDSGPTPEPACALTTPGGEVIGVDLTASEPGRFLEVAWAVPGERPATVRLEIADPDDGTAGLRMTYTADDEAQVRGAVAGWLGFLDQLGDALAVVSGAERTPAVQGIVRLAAAAQLAEHLPLT